MCLEGEATQEKKRARDDAHSSDAFPEVPRTSLKDINAPECAPDRPPQWKRPKMCVDYSSHASIEAHSLQVDSLHLIMSLWLLPQVTNQGPLDTIPTRGPICRTTHQVHTLLQCSPYLPMPLLSIPSSQAIFGHIYT